MVEARASVDDLWATWTWMGLALGCDSLTTHTATPLPFAPASVKRGRWTNGMLMDTTLCLDKTTKFGAPRTKLLSKVQSALGALRPVIRRARDLVGNKMPDKCKARRTLMHLGPMPVGVRYD